MRRSCDYSGQKIIAWLLLFATTVAVLTACKVADLRLGVREIDILHEESTNAVKAAVGGSQVLGL